jgi:hypothetical protein
MNVPTAFLPLLQHLHRGGTYGYWWTGNRKHSNWWKVGTPAALPDGRDNLYFGVHPTTAIPPTNAKGEGTPPANVRSQVVYIAALNCLFGEYDAKDFGNSKVAALAHIDALATQPSVVIDSGGGYHCYWLLSDTFVLASDDDRQRAARLQKAWVTFVGSDDDAKDLARVLRVPGTRNYKDDYAPHYPAVDVVRADYTLLYDLDALESLLPVPVATVRGGDRPMPVATADTAYARRYALGALDSAQRTMLAATDGERHAVRLREAFGLAGYMPHLSAAEITDALSVNFGADTANAMQTIRDGIREGQQQPRTIPAPAPAPAAPSDASPELERLRAENAQLRARNEKLEQWRQWSNAVIAKPGSELSPAAKVIALSQHAEMEYRQDHGMTEPAPIFIQQDCTRAGVSPDTYGKKLQELATVGALAYTPQRDTTTGHRRVLIAPGAFFEPATWQAPEQRNHGGTRIKRCVECGSENLMEQTTVYCVECGVAQGETHTRQVNPPLAMPQIAVRPSEDAPTIPQLAGIESSYSPSLIPQVTGRPPHTDAQQQQPTMPQFAVRPSEPHQQARSDATEPPPPPPNVPTGRLANGFQLARYAKLREQQIAIDLLNSSPVYQRS